MRSGIGARSGRSRARLVAERFEDRSLPAGNVTAFVSAGILNIVGDAESNRVLVAAAGRDSFAITSLDGTTTVNGGAAPVTLGGVRGINAQMNAGSDLLHVTGTRGDLTVFVEMGDGDDAAHRPTIIERESSSSRTTLDQLFGEEAIDEVLEIAAQLGGVGVVFLEQRVVRGLHRARVVQRAPHPRADPIEAEIHLRVQVDEHAFVADAAKQHVRHDTHAIRERHGHGLLTPVETSRRPAMKQ